MGCHQQNDIRCAAQIRTMHAGFRGQSKPIAKEKEREREREKEKERDREKEAAGSESSHEMAQQPRSDRAKWYITHFTNATVIASYTIAVRLPLGQLSVSRGRRG